MERSVKQNPAWPRQARFLSSLGFYLWAKCEFHMLVNCSLHLWDMLHWGQVRRVKSASLSLHNIIIIEGGLCCLGAARCKAPAAPPDMWECFLHSNSDWKEHYLYSSQYRNKQTLALQSKQRYQLMNQAMLCWCALLTVSCYNSATVVKRRQKRER